jgi:phage-related minor tail protein
VGDTSLIFDLVARDKGFDSTMAGGADAADKLAKRLEDAGKRSGQGFSSAARDIGASLQKIEKDAWETGKGTDDAFKQAVAGMRSDFERMREAGRLTGASLESDLGGALRDLKKKVDDFADHTTAELKDVGEESKGSLGEAFEGIGDLFGDALGDSGGAILGGLGAAKAGFLGAGTALAGALWAGIEAQWDRDKIGALIAAQTGAAGSQASRLGHLTGDVFVGSFAESMDQVAESMSAAFNNKLISTDDTDQQIERVTRKMLTLTTTTGEAANEIGRSARQMLVTGLAGNLQEALDMIQHASDVGLNTAEDLFDTITEYSTNFRTLGLSGQEAFGLISQATNAGARDTDMAADALKEFSIRAQDMSVLTARGFEMIGLDADTMGQRVAAGGKFAHEALKETLNALQNMPNEIDRNSAAVALFGAKAEDLGTALFSMDLDDAADQFGDFAGSVEEAAQKLENGMSPAEKLDKQFTNMKGDLGEFINELGSWGADDLDKMQNKFQELALAIEKWQTSGDMRWLDDLKKKYPELAGAIDQYIAKNKGEVDAHNESNDATRSQLVTLDDLVKKYSEIARGFLDSEGASLGWIDAMKAADQAVIDNGRNTDLMTEKGENNRKALLDMADAAWRNVESMSASGAAAVDVQTYLGGAREKFVSTALAMGYSADEANVMANKLHLIPGDYTARIHAETAQAWQGLNAIRNAIASIPRNVNIAITQTVAAVTAGHRAGGGPVDADKPYIVGEEGEEVFVPNRNGTIVPNDALRHAGDALASSAATLRPARNTGGGSVPAVMVAEWVGGPNDDLGAELFDYFRSRIKFRHGGSVQSALGQRGAA